MNRLSNNIRVILTFMALFACLLPLGLRAAPPSTVVQAAPAVAAEYHVVGVTTTTTTGAVLIEGPDPPGTPLVSYTAMNYLCRKEVDENSRVATAAEWATTYQGQFLQGTPPFAWLDPGNPILVYQPGTVSHDENWIAFTPYRQNDSITPNDSPYVAVRNTNCDQYTNLAPTGTVGWRGGRIQRLGCDNTLPIACAALVAVPVWP